ncbi:MAG: arginine--tRNA ligase [Clostridia bacterium]|nr:arginine--tRNA ligase [Clostridia bacterium]
MLNFKEIIAKKISIATEIDTKELENYIEIPPNKEMGDYAFPCFKLAKTLRKSPMIIAEEIKGKIGLDEYITKVEIVSGYLNFYINKSALTKIVLEDFNNKKEKFGSSDIGKGKTICVEYSSPNIAKPFHIGHLRTTIIGAALYRIYNYLGYKTIGINHLGDYGTQFGKLIEGYKRWGNEYDLTKEPINELMKIYIRINELCKEDESVLEACRNNFKLLEDGDEYCTSLWKEFRKISLEEFDKIYKILDVKFDSLRGEAECAKSTDALVEELEKTGKLVLSEGAKIVDLEDKKLGVCMLKKSDDSTTYATRDLSAMKYRAMEYDFDKCLYIVAYEQALHFKQVFEVAKLLNIPEKCKNGLEHVQFGMVRLTTGKMSTREGTVIKVEDLLNESISRVQKVIEEKNPNMENRDEEASKIGIGAVIFNTLSTTLIKDQVFDWDQVLNFQGETGPYIQYIYVRTKSILEKLGYIPEYKDEYISVLQDESSKKVIETLYTFEEVLKNITEKNETSFLTRFLIELSQNFSIFYNENKIVGEEKNLQDARAYLTYVVGTVLKIAAELLGIKMPNKM